VRVLLVDDHPVVRQSLARLLEAEPDVEIVGQGSTGREGIALVRHLHPDVVLMDIGMPDMDGIEATRRIHAEAPATYIIGLSMHDREERAEAMRDAGAMDYVTKTAPATELLVVMRGCYARRREEVPPEVAR
jgi:DNA-binding NarL/FixJ family response regulator